MLHLISFKPTPQICHNQLYYYPHSTHICLEVFFLFSISSQTDWINVYQVYITYYAVMYGNTFQAVASSCHILYQAQCKTSMSSKFPKNQNDGRRYWLVTDLCLCMKQNKQEHKNEQINLEFLSPTTSEVIGPLLLLCWIHIGGDTKLWGTRRYPVGNTHHHFLKFQLTRY